METKHMIDTLMRLSEMGVWRMAMENLPGNDVALLGVILRYQGESEEEGIRMSRISTLLGISKPAATQAVERLCRKEYVKRISGADRRCVCITVTESGKNYYQCRMKETERLTGRIISRMGDEDAREFNRLLAVFSDALRTEV